MYIGVHSVSVSDYNYLTKCITVQFIYISQRIPGRIPSILPYTPVPALTPEIPLPFARGMGIRGVGVGVHRLQGGVDPCSSLSTSAKVSKPSTSASSVILRMSSSATSPRLLHSPRHNNARTD